MPRGTKPIARIRVPTQPSRDLPGGSQKIPTLGARKPRRPRYTGPAQDVRDLIHARDGVCVVGMLCQGQPWRPLVPNHRVNRGMGGSSDPAVNLPSSLHLACDLCNGWLEDHPAEAYAAGWKVRRGGDPSTIPIRYPDGTWWLLDDHGGRTEVTA